MSKDADAVLLSQADFAREIGVGRSRVHALKEAGRLVMVGSLVDVEASKLRIAETRSAAHDDQGKAAIIRAEEPSDSAPRRIDAQARKEHLAAELLQMDLDERQGKLMRAEEVIAAVADAATTLRTRIEAFPDLLASQLAAINDEAQVRAELASQVEIVLAELSAGFQRVSAS